MRTIAVFAYTGMLFAAATSDITVLASTPSNASVPIAAQTDNVNAGNSSRDEFRYALKPESGLEANPGFQPATSQNAQQLRLYGHPLQDGTELYPIGQHKSGQPKPQLLAEIGDLAEQEDLANSAQNSAPNAADALSSRLENNKANTVMQSVLSWIDTSGKTYQRQIIPRLQLGGGLVLPPPDKEEPQPSPTQPGPVITLPTLEQIAQSLKTWFERSFMIYGNEVLPRLSGAAPSAISLNTEQKKPAGKANIDTAEVNADKIVVSEKKNEASEAKNDPAKPDDIARTTSGLQETNDRQDGQQQLAALQPAHAAANNPKPADNQTPGAPGDGKSVTDSREIPQVDDSSPVIAENSIELETGDKSEQAPIESHKNAAPQQFATLPPPSRLGVNNARPEADAQASELDGDLTGNWRRARKLSKQFAKRRKFRSPAKPVKAAQIARGSRLASILSPFSTPSGRFPSIQSTPPAHDQPNEAIGEAASLSPPVPEKKTFSIAANMHTSLPLPALAPKQPQRDKKNVQVNRPDDVKGHRRDERKPRKACSPSLHRRAKATGGYIVQPGDTLWDISQRHYRRGASFRRIYRANRRRIGNPNLIYPCQLIYLPSGKRRK